jgi:hypothetical protein
VFGIGVVTNDCRLTEHLPVTARNATQLALHRILNATEKRDSECCAPKRPVV